MTTKKAIDRNIFFFQAEDGIRDLTVTGVQTCALPILLRPEVGVEQIEGANGPGARVGSPPRSARHRPRGAAGRADPRSHRARRLQLIRVWRITRARHAAFEGDGARRHGGRWNQPGIPVVYTSASLALAALELFVNLERPEPPGDLVAIAADIPEMLTISRVPASELPANWRSYPPPEALADLGTRWAHELKRDRKSTRLNSSHSQISYAVFC